jgi:hypothetical protein
LLVDTVVDIAPNAPLGATTIASIPITFSFDLDADAIDQQVQPLAPLYGMFTTSVLCRRQIVLK